MKSPFLAAALWPVVLLATPNLLRADPKMPEGFSSTWTDSSGLTWRASGILPLAFTNAAAAVKSSMEAQGYALRHDIFDKDLPGYRLFLFLKADEEVTVMLHRDDDSGATGLSWGVTRSSDQAPSGHGGPSSSGSAKPSASLPESDHSSTNITETAPLP